ncbi:DUF2332 domain-containing protein [Actinophytocola sp.]|uniref:DUF2332 domain-containing protein n=1 Tax=Actinophytocola sp. TaxID=1872138 RepID=UPI002D8081DB|nr:DUF2332 domain-containing protein [Actinophytocola sp.]HET9140716.1 DUF2332 domain-containing protein [Actinophytocola sp.]
MAAVQLELVQRRMRRFATVETVPASPLYHHLAEKTAEDPEICALLTVASEEFATPTLLLAAVHRTLQANPFHELTNYYPSLGGNYGVDGATWPLFRSFVLERADAIRNLVATHTTQTNEVGRAALLYPAIALAASRTKGPVGLLEVGCSAGLLLNLDRYGYRYQTEQAGQLVAGPARAAVGLHCALELAPGATLPALPKKIAVGARIGLDRAPVDLTDEDQYAWLEACIWADQPDRSRRFAAAAGAQRGDRPELITGDAIDDLPAAAARIPAGLPVVVITSLALLYLPTERQLAFLAALSDLAARRTVSWVSHEEYASALAHLLPDQTDLVRGKGEPSFGVLGLVRWEQGRPVARALARTAWHGQRMTWLGS